MKSRLLSVAVMAVFLVLAGCDKAPTTSGADSSAQASIPVSIATIAAEAKGFLVGAPMSARTVYVFFDSQCPHCADLWEAAKPLRSQAKFVWIPVGILNKTSTTQGAALLASKDPAIAMDEHETSMRAHQGGITGGGDLAAQQAMVTKNTKLMTRFGFNGIPTIVGAHAVTGALVTQEGASPTAALAELLGLRVPAGESTAPSS